MHAKKNNVWVKLNYLLYAGETEKTYDETVSWLDTHSDSIKGISAGPVVIFGSPLTASNLISSATTDGAIVVDSRSCETSGITNIHPSVTISNLDAEKMSLAVSKRFMTKNDYFDLKSFSYYPRTYTFFDFEADITCCNAENLPFS